MSKVKVRPSCYSPNHAGDRGHRETCYGRPLRFVLSVCGQSEDQQRQAQRERQYQERNRFLAWAFVEAANFAIRFNSKIKSFYQRKKAKTKAVVAIKAVAQKLCRACYHIMKIRSPLM